MEERRPGKGNGSGGRARARSARAVSCSLMEERELGHLPSTRGTGREGGRADGLSEGLLCVPGWGHVGLFLMGTVLCTFDAKPEFLF